MVASAHKAHLAAVRKILRVRPQSAQVVAYQRCLMALLATYQPLADWISAYHPLPKSPPARRVVKLVPHLIVFV